MAFFTKVSDKAVGGSYMTLLNTISNIGTNWPQTLALFLVDFFTLKSCTYDSSIRFLNSSARAIDNLRSILDKIDKNYCSSDAEIKECNYLNGKCVVLVDAYYFVAVCCGLTGIYWIVKNRTSLYFLQNLEKSVWKIRLKN